MIKHMKFIFIYITNPSKEVAKKIAGHLLEKKLIACANIFPIDSFYLWEGKVEEEDECVLIAKAREENFQLVKKEVEGIHPHSVPCIAKIPVAFNEKYRRWLKEATR